MINKLVLLIIIIIIFYTMTINNNCECFSISSNINHEELNYDILLKLQKDIDYIKKKLKKK